MSDPGKAVFLSYASQDAEAAKRIADSLRAVSVEVWFDAEGGLEHGDEWDAKIRRQIKECVLFIPIISANTQAREEGYFRLEWDMAAERARSIASGVAFILPVIIDATRESDALVPDRFRAVQWTRLPGGNVPPDVLQRFLKLWSHRTGLLKHAENVGRDLRIPPATNEAGFGDPALQKARPRWLVPAIVSVAAVAVVAVWIALKPSSPPASSLPPPASPAAQAAVSEAHALVTKAWEQLNRTGLYRTELEIADGLLKRAAELAQDDPEVWAAWAHVDAWYVYHNLDPSPERREGARQKAARALRLDAQSYEARLADACYIVRATGAQPGTGRAGDSLPAAEQTLRDLARERPDDHRPRYALGILLRNARRFDEGVAEFERMALLPGRAATAWNEKGWLLLLAADYRGAVEAADRSIAVQPYFGNLLLRLNLARSWTGDLELAKAAAAQLPPSVRTEEVIVASTVALFRWRREPAEMLRILDAVPRAWIASQGFNGPKYFLVAEAHRMAGREDAAQLGWREALRLIEQRLEKEPASAPLLTLKARTLWALGRQPEARQTARLAESFGDANGLDLLLELGELDRALAALQQLMAAPTLAVTATTSWAELKLNPRFDPLRSDPRFQSLLAQAEADPRRNPHAMTKRESSDTGAAAAKSVAVLAFANLSDDKGNEYFSDGISEELLNVLAKVPGLKVMARTSSFHFKGKDTPIADIAQQLGVAYVVEGSVRKQGDKVRITAQLIKAADGFHVWSDTFTRELKDIFAVQDEIAGLIAQQLQLKLGDSARVTKVVNPEAYRLLLEGRQFWNLRTEEGFAKAETAFSKSLTIDPQFAEAHAGLAGVYVIRSAYRELDGIAIDADDLQRADSEGRRALEIDPSSAEAHAALGHVDYLANRLGASDRHYQQALTFSPNSALVHCWYALLLSAQGRLDASLQHYQQAAELDPLWFINLHMLGRELALAQRFDQSLGIIERAAALRTEIFLPNSGERARALLELGRKEEAFEAARHILRHPDDRPRWHSDAVAIRVLWEGGRRQEAEDESARLFTRWPPDSYLRGFTLVALGRFDEALAFLKHTPSSMVRSLYWESMWDPWREDPRFAQLLARLGRAEEYKVGREALARLLKESGAKK